jgi:stage II sporulation protein AA (anti-sigma F factor antagonist)
MMVRREIRKGKGESKMENKGQAIPAGVTTRDIPASGRQKKHVLCVELCGEVDHHRAVVLRRWLDQMIRERRPSVLRLDLSGIAFMDSSGLGLIMGRYSLLTRLGGEMIVVDPSAPARRMLRLAGMERMLRIEQNEKKQEK